MKIVGVVLSIGERTEGFAKHLLEKQIEDVRLVKGYGRAEAIIEAWKIGMEADILVLITSDFLVKKGVIKEMISHLKSCNRLSCYGDDKFTGRNNTCPSIYPSNILPDLLFHIKNHMNHLRPESIAVKAVGNYNILQLVGGLHEYELDYREIYDKYNYNKKKRQRLRRYIGPFEILAEKDDDYKAVLLALKDMPFDMGKKPPIESFKELEKKYNL